MSSNDLRKLMNLMESADSKGEYYVDSDGDDHHVFHTDKGKGKAYGTHASKEAAQADADTRNGKVKESVEELDESIDLSEGVVGMDTDAVLWHLFELGRNAASVMGSKAEEKARQIQQELIAVIGPTIGTVGESMFEDESIMETGNANAQQKGINFNGTPANKNKGDMDQSSPKSKGPGSKSALAQAVAGTKVGQIKS